MGVELTYREYKQLKDLHNLFESGEANKNCSKNKYIDMLRRSQSAEMYGHDIYMLNLSDTKNYFVNGDGTTTLKIDYIIESLKFINENYN